MVAGSYNVVYYTRSGRRSDYDCDVSEHYVARLMRSGAGGDSYAIATLVSSGAQSQIMVGPKGVVDSFPWDDEMFDALGG